MTIRICSQLKVAKKSCESCTDFVWFKYQMGFIRRGKFCIKNREILVKKRTDSHTKYLVAAISCSSSGEPCVHDYSSGYGEQERKKKQLANRQSERFTMSY